MITLKNGPNREARTIISEADLVSASAYEDSHEAFVGKVDKPLVLFGKTIFVFKEKKYKTVVHYGIRINFRSRNGHQVYANYKEDKGTRDSDLIKLSNIQPISLYPPCV
ncbi:MAG: hypothetical protein M0R32_08230 [Candidatus Cloacimonetes bacterium]|jgi:hypothetical protein|nr:hypothetical protein [Candidatus Cloacimonadota bacterium]